MDEIALQKVDLDSASVDELRTLPNVGDKVAEAIIWVLETYSYIRKIELASIRGFRPTPEFWASVEFKEPDIPRTTSETQAKDSEPCHYIDVRPD